MKPVVPILVIATTAPAVASARFRNFPACRRRRRQRSMLWSTAIGWIRMETCRPVA